MAPTAAVHVVLAVVLATGAATGLAAPARAEATPATDPSPAATFSSLPVVVPGADGSDQPGTRGARPAPGATSGTLMADEQPAPGRLATAPVPVEDVQTVGVTWAAGDDGTQLDAQVRWQDASGTWSSWHTLDEQAPADPGTADAAHEKRAGTEPLWIDDATAVQLSVAAGGATVPADLRLALVGSPASAAGARAAEVAGAQQLPRVISRAEWGAPPQVCAPDVASGLVGAAVHHTADSNAYSTVAEAEQMIRNDTIYHQQGRGWCDLGYNFVVDKWGNVYEGRAGSLTAPVIGVHAGGFNTGTVGVALLGTYDSAPSAAAQNAVGTIIGWRLGAYRVDPRGGMEYWTGVGENSRYQNQAVWLSRVFGHRDVAYTSCPGNGGYAALPAIRDIAWDAAQQFWGQPPSSLMRTPENATVYLVSGAYRYPIADLATMSALSPLGDVAIVPQQYLDFWTVGPLMRRVVLGPDGTVYFVDAGIRLSFSTCAQVAEFGYGCGDAIPLDATQIAALYYGGRMTNLYRTTTGKAFYVSAGTKREVADDASLTAAGLAGPSVTLLETGLAYLPYGSPVVRDGLRLDGRDGALSIVTSPDGDVALRGGLRSVPGLWSGPVAALDAASLARMPVTTVLGPFVADPVTGAPVFLSDRGRWVVTDPTSVPADLPRIPVGLLSSVPVAGTLGAPMVFKAPADGTVYLAQSGARRAIRGWGDLLRLTGGADPAITTVAYGIVASLPDGGLYNPPGMLARTVGDATVYLLDGADRKVPVTTFAMTAELGATRFDYVSDGELAGRTAAPAALGLVVDCQGGTFVGVGGRLWPVRPQDRAAFPPTSTPLEDSTCAALPRGGHDADLFWRASDGTIYLLDGGAKHPITSWQRFLDLGGSMAITTQVSDFAASRIPTGAFA